MLERVQRRGTKVVAGIQRLEYPARLEKLNLFPLVYRRTRGDLIYTWRILHGKLGEELMENYQVQHDKISRGHDWKLFKPQRYRLGAGLTLSTRVVNNWNLLPDDVVEADTEEKFKSKLDSYLLTTPSRVCGLWKSRSH